MIKELNPTDGTTATAPKEMGQLLSDIFQAKVLPADELAEVVLRGEESIPLLMKALESALDSEPTDAQDVSYGLLLLAQLRHRPAFPLFLRLARHPRVDAWIGDMVTESLGRCLAACWNGELQPLVDLANDEGLDEFVRSQGPEAIACLSLAGELPRDRALGILNGLLRASVHGDGPVMPIHWLDAIATLYPDSEGEYLIREAFAKDLIPAFEFSLAEFEELMEDGLERTWEASRNSPHHTLVIDAVKDSCWWSVWENTRSSASVESIEPLEYRPIEPMKYRQVEQLRSDKVGRNDPCPCHSGKKFKKCCGA